MFFFNIVDSSYQMCPSVDQVVRFCYVTHVLALRVHTFNTCSLQFLREGVGVEVKVA